MGITRSSALNILQQSPHDLEVQKLSSVSIDPGMQHWVPSRFNVRATADDGRLVLWNSMKTSMVVFTAEQVPMVLELLSKEGFQAREEGLVQYLASRGFLVKKDVNEYRRFQLAFGEQHYRSDVLQLILMASEDCNFRCKYCYEDFARGTMRPEVRQGLKRLVEKRIGDLKRLEVEWFGGEPLYGWAAVEDLGPFFLETARKAGVHYRGSMTTNGFLLTPDVAEKLLAWQIKSFQITLDGAPEDHDCSRPARNGQGTFWTIFENLKSLAQRKDDFYVNLRVNFDPTNHVRMDRFLDLVQKAFQGDSRFKLNFHAVGRWGGPNDANLEVCGADERGAILEAMKAAAHERGLRFGTLRDVNFFGGQVCYAARPFNFLIGATGAVMKCTLALDKDVNNVVGKVTENGDLELDQDKMALWTEPAFEKDGQCQKCAVLPSCQGLHCPIVRMNQKTQPCIPTRTNPHGELLEVAKYNHATARQKAVIVS